MGNVSASSPADDSSAIFGTWAGTGTHTVSGSQWQQDQNCQLTAAAPLDDKDDTVTSPPHKKPRAPVPLAFFEDKQPAERTMCTNGLDTCQQLPSEPVESIPPQLTKEPASIAFSPAYILEQKLRVTIAARAVLAKEFMESLRCNNLPFDEKQMETLLKLLELIAPMPISQGTETHPVALDVLQPPTVTLQHLVPAPIVHQGPQGPLPNQFPHDHQSSGYCWQQQGQGVIGTGLPPVTALTGTTARAS
eukprot:jgi/Botrbrau1/12163/Bobra.0186s0072.2